MAGTIVGISNALNSNGIDSYNYEHTTEFHNFYRFMQVMETAGYCDVVAINYGTSGSYGPGNGIGYPTESTGWGTNAFVVWRMKGTASGNTASSRSFDYYLLAQCAVTWPSATPQGPSNVDGSTTLDGVGLMMAFREDGGNPWGGTVLADGADSKTSPVWVDGGSTLHVMGVQNTTGGTYATNKESLTRVTAAYTTTGLIRHASYCGDADTIIVVDHTWPSLTYAGVYIPRTGLTSNFPLIFYRNSTFHIATTVCGTAGGSTTREGGVWSPVDGVVPFYTVDFVTGLSDSTSYHPNQQFSEPRYMESPVGIGVRSPTKGMLGTFDPNLITNTFARDYTVDSTGTRIHLTVNSGYPSYTTPWGDTVAPTLRFSREGVTF